MTKCTLKKYKRLFYFFISLSISLHNFRLNRCRVKQTTKMIFSFIFFTSLCLVHSLPNSVVGAYPGYRPYGHVGQRVTVVSSPGYVQSSQSSFGHGSTGHGGQSDYGHGSNSWNHGTGAVQHGGGASQWNQGESTSWGKEYGSSNRHNVGAQSGYGHSSVGSHSLGHGQAGYGHNSGYGFNQGGYGHQSQFGVSHLS